MRGFSVVMAGVLISVMMSACSSKNKALKSTPVYNQIVIQPDTGTFAPQMRELEPEKEVLIRSPQFFTPGLDGKRDDLEWAGTVNFNLRKPDFVILHHTAQQSVEQTIRTFNLEHTQVSAHYLVGRDGKVYQLLNDYLRAWHAGNARWGKVTDMNSHSIGIELDNNGSELFPPQQISSLINLLDTLKTRYNIPQANFIGHADIAPTRKQDPSVHFPWKILADSGFGLWYDEYLPEVPEGFDPTLALRLIGYDTRNLNAAIIAFKRHYIQYDISPELTDFDLRVLYNLFRKQE